MKEVEWYKKKNKVDKEELAALITAFVHHIIISVYCLYMFAVVCTDSDFQSINDSEWRYFRYYDSETCRRMPNQMYGNAIMISTSYLLWDIIKMLVYNEEWPKPIRENFYHHLIATTGINGTLICAHGAPGIAANLLLTEISSIFLSIRNLTPREYHSETWFLPILLGFFVTFTIVRIAMAPFSLRNTYTETMFFWEERNGIETFFMLLCFGMNIFLTVLNCYWYILILKMLKRTFIGGGEKDKSSKTD